MKRTSIANLREQLSKLLDCVQKGEEIEIQRRNVTIARMTPVKRAKPNATQLGVGKDTVKFLDDVVGPAIPSSSWEMLK